MEDLPDILPFRRRLDELSAQMAEPSFYANPRRAAEVTREQQRLAQLVAERLGSGAPDRAVRHAVTGQFVSLTHHAPDEFGVFVHHVPEHEERAAPAVTGEQVEDGVRPAIHDALVRLRVGDDVDLAVVPVLDVERERGAMGETGPQGLRRYTIRPAWSYTRSNRAPSASSAVHGVAPSKSSVR